jgi:hypothetical protein
MNIDGEVELLGRKKDFIKNARSEIVYFRNWRCFNEHFILNDIGIISFWKWIRKNFICRTECEESEYRKSIEEIKKSWYKKLGLVKFHLL